MSKEKHLSGKQLYSRIFHYARHYWWALAIGIVGNAASSSVDASLTYLLKPILNKGFIDRDVHFITWLPLLVVLIFIARALTNYLGSYFMTYIARSVVMRVRSDVFAHLLKIPATYYDNSSSGQILSVLIYNVEQLANVSADALTDLIQSFFLIAGLLVVMFSVSWQLSLIYFLTVPAIAFVVRSNSKRVRKVNHAIQKGMGTITSIAEETITGYKVVRAFGGQEYEQNKFNQALNDNRRRELKNTTTKTISVSAVQLIAAVALSIIVYLATSHTATQLTAGGFVTLVAAMLAILKPLKTFSTVNNTIQRGLAGAQSVFALLDDEVEKDHGHIKLDRATGNIEYRDVSFVYPKTDKTVLHHISFDVPAGKTIALVGRSGSGKSTIVSLLPRFYDYQQGTIFLDGQNIKNYTLASLRQQMAIVSQHVTLFNDTVANNIAYGINNNATEAEIIEAAKAAHAWEFISQFPQGIQTLIGENGVLLSGGQRQRIAIARAILRNAPILILDEATSALDTESERYIQEALEKLMKNRTTIVIAHRLSTVEKADKIIVMDQGEIVEVGAHAELLAKNGYYAKLYQMQFN